MYRFARRPLWILSHAFVAFLVVLCVNLGFWQLRRHDERADRNATVVTRSEMEPVDVGTLLDGPVDAEKLRYRPVDATGTYLSGADLLIDNRSSDGLPGAWVVTPLRTDDGIIAVSRGFLRFEDGELRPPAPPTGEVNVTGTLLPWSDDCGVRRDDEGGPVGASCLDRDAVTELSGNSVAPIVIQQRSSSADDQGLVAVPLPELDSGPHRGYAVQWFIFATIGVIGYPLVLRNVARGRAGSPEPASPERSGPGAA